jgi:hypothetical protein
VAATYGWDFLYWDQISFLWDFKISRRVMYINAVNKKYPTVRKTQRQKAELFNSYFVSVFRKSRNTSDNNDII